MKTLIKMAVLVLALIIMVAPFYSPRVALAVGFNSVICEDIPSSGERNVVVRMVADATAATYVSFVDTGYACVTANYSGTVSEFIQGWYLYGIQLIPQTPTPTTGITITYKDQYGMDVVGGKMTSISTASVVDVTPMLDTISSLYRYPKIRGAMTTAITGNSVNSAVTLLVYRYLAPVDWRH